MEHIERDSGLIFMKFDWGYPKFKWFILKHFGIAVCHDIEDLRKENRLDDLMSKLIDIWYDLPDNQFNIMENPPGWPEFLNVIEE